MKTTIFAIVALLSTTTFAASDTGTLTLTGTVAAKYEISLDTNTATVDIVNGNTKLLAATATEVSNSLTGYKVQMKSLKGSKLVNSSDATKFTTYKVFYGSNPTGYTLSDTTYQTVNSPNPSPYSVTPVQSAIKVDVVAYALAPAGTYSDVITVNIAAP